MLLSSVSSHATTGNPQAAGVTGTIGMAPAHLSRALLVQPKHAREHALQRPSAERTPSISIAPPAVKLVDDAHLVSLRDDIDDSLFEHSDHRWSTATEQGFWRMVDIASDDPRLFDSDPDYLSLDDPLVCAGLVLLLSVLLGLAGSWVFGRPMRNMASTFGAVASDRHPGHVTAERGPGRLRHLARACNEMLTRRCHASAEQSATLAVLAAHLQAQAARLRGTALQVKEWHRRVALVEDVDLFSHIATQFVEAGGATPAPESDLPVEAFIRDRFVLTSALDAGLFHCTFDAGEAFTLPRPFLERVMSNLVDNALEHGVPPIEIRTSRTRDEWVLSFRDHGAGIKQSELSKATSAFVRLGNQDDDGRHWGLGLALVRKLVADAGGLLILGNHPGGGLLVRMVFSTAGKSTAGALLIA